MQQFGVFKKTEKNGTLYTRTVCSEYDLHKIRYSFNCCKSINAFIVHNLILIFPVNMSVIPDSGKQIVKGGSLFKFITTTGQSTFQIITMLKTD